MSLVKRCVQRSHLLPFKILLKPIFRGFEANTFSIVTFLWFTILYREGYSSAKDLSPNHLSSQNLVFRPLPATKDPLEKIHISHSLIPSKKKGESIGFTET